MKRKIMIVITVLFVLFALYGVDYVRSTLYHINLVSLSPDPVPADGQTKVKVVVRLTDSSGNPVANHSLFAFINGGGTLVSSREYTGVNGSATFIYYPYQVSAINTLQNVQLGMIDESNSLVFEVNTKANFTIKMINAKSSDNNDVDLSGVFGQ